MNFNFNLPQLNKQLSALTLEKEELGKQLNTLTIDKQEYLKKLEASDKELEDLKKEKKQLEDKIKELETKFAEGKKDEAAVITAVEQSVDKQVIQKLAAIGVAEGTVTETVAIPVSMTSSEIYQKFESLKGTDKVQFYNTNKKTILAEMKKLHYVPLNTK